MILKSAICDAVVSYFYSESWGELISQMRRGAEVRHAHAYVESILHPEPLIRVVEEYFKAQGLPLQRKIYVIPPANVHGMTDIYNIHPRRDYGHCELIFHYNPDHVITPRSGKSVEVWDDAYMERLYAHYGFRTKLAEQDKKDLKAYFDSREWKLQYLFMLGGTNRHAHSLIETSIHPEIIQKYAVKALEEKGWEVGKSVSIVYTQRGCDFGKITILVKKPEIMLELEWDYNPDVTIKPGAEPLLLNTTLDDLRSCMSGLEYIRLDNSAVNEICERIKEKAKKK